jgi:hypothetical protein
LDALDDCLGAGSLDCGQAVGQNRIEGRVIDV